MRFLLNKAKLSGGLLLANVTGSLGVPLLPRRLLYILYNFKTCRICHNALVKSMPALDTTERLHSSLTSTLSRRTCLVLLSSHFCFILSVLTFTLYVGQAMLVLHFRQWCKIFFPVNAFHQEKKTDV